MQIIDTLADLLSFRQTKSHQRLALVPTLGNLHSGHLSLIAQAQQHADQVMVSIYVNPSQFGVNEDWQRYPRTVSQDLQQLQQAGVDYVWLPNDALLYPLGLEQHTRVTTPGLDNILCGAFRPGHFSGVATIVSKLFNWIQPDCAVFGEKDYQQLLVIQRLCREMGYPLQLIHAPTARAADGLALSSRNQYLSAAERQLAPEIFNCLTECRQQLTSLAPDAPNWLARHTELCGFYQQRLSQQGFVVDYFAIRRQQDLAEATSPADPLIILTAARLNQTRLIDNLKV